ncbi:MAG: SURF1 family protein [Sulfurifustis sp.]
MPRRNAPGSRSARRAPLLATRRIAVGLVLALLGVALFCALGAWQLQRADEKRALQAVYDRRTAQLPILLTSTVLPAEALQYFRVEASGFYERGYQLLLDNRAHHGVPGFEVVTPLRIAGSDARVLVNRGWVPLGADRTRPPVVDPPAERVVVRGVAVIPRVGFQLGAPDPLRREGATVWQQLDLARYVAETRFKLQPIVILLDPQSPAGGYTREWGRLDAGIAVHQSYALQWFALAAAVVISYGVWAVRRVRRGRGGVA